MKDLLVSHDNSDSFSAEIYCRWIEHGYGLCVCVCVCLYFCVLSPVIVYAGRAHEL